MAALLAAPWASAVVAAPESCFNDTDCSGQECGGWVCDWNLASPNPVGDKMYTCVPPGTKPKGMDGWCTGPTDENCKCRGLGAKCVGVYCTFTQPGDAPGAGPGFPGGATSTGGATSSAGSPSSAGTPAMGGTSSMPGSQAPMGQGDTERTVQACHVRNPGRESPAACWALLAGFAAVFVARCRKRARIPQ